MNAIGLAAVVGTVLVAVGLAGSVWAFFEIWLAKTKSGKNYRSLTGPDADEWAKLVLALSPLMRTTGGIALVQLVLGTLLLTTAAIATATGA